MCYIKNTQERSNTHLERTMRGGRGVAITLHPRCMVLHGCEAMPQMLALASSGRSKPNSLSEGADNDVLIPCCERCRSFSCLFAPVVLCQAPGPASSWKGGSSSSIGGLHRGRHTGIPVGDVILNVSTLFLESPKCQGWGTCQ